MVKVAGQEKVQIFQKIYFHISDIEFDALSNEGHKFEIY